MSRIFYCKTHRRQPTIPFPCSALGDRQAQLPLGWCIRCGGEIFTPDSRYCLRCTQEKGAML